MHRLFWALLEPGTFQALSSSQVSFDPEMYVLINPFAGGTARGAAAGVSSYLNAAVPLIREMIEVQVIDRPFGCSDDDFRELVRDTLVELQLSRPLFVEAPESFASTAKCSDIRNIHIRCHCPGAVSQYYDVRPVDHQRLELELEQCRRATWVSAPSEIMGRVIRGALPRVPVRIYPHAPPPLVAPTDKNFDVLYIARNQKLKGVDLLPQLLRGLPAELSVIIAGAGTESLKLGRGIRCQVDRLGEVGGVDRDDLIARARVLVQLSRFESFGMCLVEALALGTPSVSTEVGIASRLQAMDVALLASSPEQFVESISRQIASPPPRSSYLTAHARLSSEFSVGVSSIVARQNGRLELGQDGLLAQIGLENASLKKTGLNVDAFGRKWRKLRRDPMAFVRDARVPFVDKRLGEFRDELIGDSTGKRTRTEQSVHSKRLLKDSDQVPAEPRVVADIFESEGRVVIDQWQRKVAEKDLSTVVFCPRGKGYLVELPLIGEMCSGVGFVGFRDRYLFAVREGLGPQFNALASVGALLEAVPGPWKDGFLREMRNAVFLDPKSVTLALVRATHPKTRTIVFFTEDPSEVVRQLPDPIDVVVTLSTVSASDIPAHRKLTVDNQHGFVDILKELILEHKNKEKNMFLPVYGDVGYVPDIEQLLDSQFDGVLIFGEDGPLVPAGHTFREVVLGFLPSIRGVLMREEQRIRYQDYCENGDLEGLLMASFNDGCRYAERT